ncbi:hypothetical protein TRIUR3_25792 [Triticum urartu]|uniref:Uncharacterized protein n=1 Tax=Triticum urartu TaxID=4572 RepID=M7ZQ20_TRIUA|nr:hypothetical protein TRIUR3_25792 [Triticum urartu]
MKNLLVIDPCETSEPIEEIRYKHEDNANFILDGLRRCIHVNMPGWHVPAQGWTINYNVGMHESCEIEDSRLFIVNYIRGSLDYTWRWRLPLTPGRLQYLRKLIAYEPHLFVRTRRSIGKDPLFCKARDLPAPAAALMSWRELGLDLEAWKTLELLQKSTAWGRRRLAPATCHCPVLVLPLPFPSSSWRTDDAGPALFAPPAAPLPLMLPAAHSPAAQVRLLAADFCLVKEAVIGGGLGAEEWSTSTDAASVDLR